MINFNNKEQQICIDAILLFLNDKNNNQETFKLQRQVTIIKNTDNTVNIWQLNVFMPKDLKTFSELIYDILDWKHIIWMASCNNDFLKYSSIYTWWNKSNIIDIIKDKNDIEKYLYASAISDILSEALKAERYDIMMFLDWVIESEDALKTAVEKFDLKLEYTDGETFVKV